MNELLMARIFQPKLKNMDVNFHRIETGRTCVGIPDWYLRTQCIDIWIEAKELKSWPKKASTRITIPFQPGQYNWIRRHKKLNGKVLLAVTYRAIWYIFADIRLDYTIREFEFLNLVPGDFKEMSSYSLISLLHSV